MKRLILLLLVLTVMTLTACNIEQDEALDVVEQENVVEEDVVFDDEDDLDIGLVDDFCGEEFLPDEDYDVEEPIYIRHRTDLAQVGDIIQFGEYSWIVLDVYGDHALILSEYVLVIHYSKNRISDRWVTWTPDAPTDISWVSGVFHEIHEITTWASSSLRRYLNNEFFNSFAPAERARIRETYVITTNNPWYFDEDNYMSMGYGGGNTHDYIFVLSVEEILQYFGDSGQYENPPGGVRWISDEYNEARIGRNLEGQPLWWWSRTPGRYRRLIAGVDVTGIIYVGGMSAASYGGGTRPAMWINLTYPWNQDNFADVREPLHLDEDTPHGELAMEHLLFMNDHLYSRLGFTQREEEAAVWIIEELLAMGHSWESIDVQLFPSQVDLWCRVPPAGFEFLESAISSQNIVLTLPGQREEKIIVAAHYDSWDTPGASDNASGTAVLLESAQRMLEVDNYYTIQYVFFGAHEVGSVPPTFFINNLSEEEEGNIVLMVNVDNLFDGPYMFFGAAYNDNWQPGANALTQKIDAIAQELDLGLMGHPPMAYVMSDHSTFLYRDHTVVFLMALHRSEIPGQVGFFERGGYQFVRGWSHTTNDDVHIIEARYPGLIQRNIHAYSLFLDEILSRLHLR